LVQKKPIKKDIKVDPNEDALILRSEARDFILNNIYRSIYIQGGAGSGKSVSFFEPIIRQLMKNNFSGILYDYKNPQLSRAVFHYASKYGSTIKPYILDFKNAYNSIRVNPLNPIYMTKSAYAFEHAQTLLYNLAPENIKNPNYFTNDAKSILTALIWYLKREHPQYCTLPHVIALALYSDMKSLLLKMSENLEVEGMISSIKEAIDQNAGKQVAGVLSTLKTNLSKLNIPEVFWLLSGNDIDLDINSKKVPKFLCIGTDSQLSQTYAPVVSLIISVAIKQMNEQGKHRSAIVIDELPTIYLESIDELPAVARSNKISTILGVQDFSQLVLKYGRDKANVILSNMGTQFFGRTVEKSSAQMISQLFGRTDKTYNTTSRGDNYNDNTLFGKHTNSKNINTSESIQERDRVKVTDIMNLQPGEFYGFIAEGNETEVLKSKFLMDDEIIDFEFEHKSKATEKMILDNYAKIINESKSIIASKQSTEPIGNDVDLIKF